MTLHCVIPRSSGSGRVVASPASLSHRSARKIAPASCGVPVRRRPASLLRVLLLFIVPAVCSASGADLVLEPLLRTPVAGVVSASPLGDEELLVATLEGRIWRFEGPRLASPAFLDIRHRAATDYGLFSFALHPSFAQNGLIFVHYAERGSGDSIVSRMKRSSLSPNQIDPSSEAILLRVSKPARGHYGGQLVFGPDGFLYVSTGDSTGPATGRDPTCSSQDIESLEGKILRLDIDRGSDSPPFYSIPEENPLVGYPQPASPEIWTWGLRNPWRFSFDRATGDLWIGDVGQHRFEELNLLSAETVRVNSSSEPYDVRLNGRNFGWKLNEGTFCHDDRGGCPAGTHGCKAANFIQPKIEYDHTDGRCAVVAGHVYRGHGLPSLAGRMIYADLCAGTIWAAQQQGGLWIPEVLPVRMERINSFAEDADGELLVLAEDTVYRLVDRTIPPGGLVQMTAAEMDVVEGVGAAMVFAAREGGSEGAVTATFRVVAESATPELDYGISATTLSWGDGESGSRAIGIPIVDDEEPESDETMTVLLSSLEGDAIIGGRKSTRITVLDDEVCLTSATRLCLAEGRFQVVLGWSSAEERGAAFAVSGGPNAGSFWFFSEDNPEVFVKVLNACFEPFNRFWIFAAGLTNLATRLEVLDTESGLRQVYEQLPGRAFESIQDFDSFATCDSP